MFGLTLLTWETGIGVNKYIRPVAHKMLYNTLGHAALSLTIPDNDENRRLINELNKTGHLKVKYEDTIVPEKVEEPPPPHYKARKEKAIVAYFSFWSHPDTGIVPNTGNFIADQFKDRTGEAEGYVGKYPPIIRFDEKEEETAKKKEEKLKELSQKEQQITTHIRTIHALLSKRGMDKEKILASPKIQKIFKSYGVSSFEELQQQLTETSTELEALYGEVESMGGVIGRLPDSAVHLPISLDPQDVALDYRAVLTEMAKIANEPNPYQLLSRNCSSTARSCITKGITPTLREQLTESGFKEHTSFIETPQGVMLYAAKLQTALLNLLKSQDTLIMESPKGKKDLGANKNKTRLSADTRIYALIIDALNRIFCPKEVLKKQIDEERVLITYIQKDIDTMRKLQTSKDAPKNAIRIEHEESVLKDLNEQLKTHNARLTQLQTKLLGASQKKELITQAPQQAMTIH